MQLPGLKRKGLKLEEQVGQILMPGDEFVRPTGETVTVGPGLKFLPSVEGVRKECIIVCKAGILAHRKPNVFYMEVRQRNVSCNYSFSQSFYRYNENIRLFIITVSILCSTPHTRRTTWWGLLNRRKGSNILLILALGIV